MKPSLSGRVVYSVVIAACGTDSRGFKPHTSINACRHVCRYVDQKGSDTMLTSIQSAGVAPEVNLGITQARKHARDQPWLGNPGQMLPEVQNSGISGSTKRTYILQFFLKVHELPAECYSETFQVCGSFRGHGHFLKNQQPEIEWPEIPRLLHSVAQQKCGNLKILVCITCFLQ